MAKTNTGKTLERVVRKVAERLHDRQKAKLWKIPNDLRITTSGEAIWGDQNPADFFGHTITGRFVLIECKNIQGSRLSLGTRGLKPHQFLALQEAHDTGAIALVVWARQEQVAVLDMDMIRRLTASRRSVGWSTIPAKFIRPYDEEGILELLETHHV
jgi:penicillin-binding protein-related factor A (putative recombinase)